MGFSHHLGRMTGIACALAAALTATASQAATGSEFILNQLTALDGTGHPLQYANSPTMKRGPAGNFIVSWAGGPTATSPIAIYAQVFASNGSPLGTPVQVALGTGEPASYWTPALAVSKTGDSAIAWQQFDAKYKTHVMIQRFDPSGSPKGAVIDAGIQDSYGYFLIFALSTAESTPPMIAMDDTGNLAVAWSTSKEFRSSPTDGDLGGWNKGSGSSKTWVTEYRPDGTVLKAKFAADTQYSAQLGPCAPFSTCATNANLLRSLAMNGSGNLVMVLDVERPTGSNGIGTRYYTAGLKASGGLRPLSSIGKYDFQGLGIDSAGTYTIQWNDLNYANNLARFGIDGSSIGIPVGPLAPPAGGSYLGFTENASGVVALPVCNYQEEDFYGDGNSEYNASCTVQYYNSNLAPMGAPVLIPSDPTDLNNGINAALADNGSLVSIWSGMLNDKKTAAILGTLTSAP